MSTLANQNLFDLIMTLSIAMVKIIIMEPTAPIPQDALMNGSSSTPMVLACQAAHIPIEMNGTMILISATLLAPTDTLML